MDYMDDIDLSVTLPDDLYEVADRIEEVLKATGDLTPSLAARKAKVPTHVARRVLDWMVAHGYAHTSGNGAWTHYHPGRRR